MWIHISLTTACDPECVGTIHRDRNQHRHGTGAIMTTEFDFDSHIILPLPPQTSDKLEMEIYARFMRHLRHVPNTNPSIKVLAAIQFVADMTDTSDAHVAKILVEHGLRAPRLAFPTAFLIHVDKALQRDGWEIGSASVECRALDAHWQQTDRIAPTVASICASVNDNAYPNFAG